MIVDLEHAARDRDGRVRFDADVVLVKAPRPGGLLLAVANRGRIAALPMSRVPLLGEPGMEIGIGDGWMLEQGLSLLWVGWQWDIARGPGVVGIEAPQALDGQGKPIRGQARLGFQPVEDIYRRRLADEVPMLGTEFASLPVANVDDPDAVLTEREWFNGPAVVMERTRWRFPDDDHIELDGGFRARHHYELTYTTSSCPVAGVGLVAVRDVVAHLRAGYTHTLAHGVSQSGRWLRQFIQDTGNSDEVGEQVFDGVHVHLAGGRRGEFNHRYAQPSTMNHLGFGHLPPFSPEDGLFERARRSRTAPKTIFTNSATEYWRGDASLVHPVAEGADWRAYAYAGADHLGGMSEYARALPLQLAGNQVDTSWAVRAHFAALAGWVGQNVVPPPSTVPSPADGTGADRDEVLAGLLTHSALGDLDLPSPEALLGMPPVDLGPGADQGVGSFPTAVTGPARRCVVSRVDADGNEIGGVRLPHVAVPLDVSFGWNAEQPRAGVPVEIWNLVGASIPMERDEVLGRYGTRGGFLERVDAVASELAEQRHLLTGDIAAVVEDAASRWDQLMEPSSAHQHGPR